MLACTWVLLIAILMCLRAHEYYYELYCLHTSTTTSDLLACKRVLLLLAVLVCASKQRESGMLSEAFSLFFICVAVGMYAHLRYSALCILV